MPILTILTLLLAPLAVWRRNPNDPLFANALIAIGALGLAVTVGQGFAIGISGWEFALLERAFGPLGDRQFGMGYGAVLTSAAFLRSRSSRRRTAAPEAAHPCPEEEPAGEGLYTTPA